MKITPFHTTIKLAADYLNRGWLLLAYCRFTKKNLVPLKYTTQYTDPNQIRTCPRMGGFLSYNDMSIQPMGASQYRHMNCHLLDSDTVCVSLSGYMLKLRALSNRSTTNSLPSKNKQNNYELS